LAINLAYSEQTSQLFDVSVYSSLESISIILNSIMRLNNLDT
jgi:hypothetical protein